METALTGAVIGAAIWATLLLIALLDDAGKHTIDIPQTLFRGGVLIGVFAFWGAVWGMVA